MFLRRDKTITSTYIEQLQQVPSYALSVRFTVKQLDYSKSVEMILDGNELWAKLGVPLGDPMAPVTIETEIREMEKW